MLRRIPESKNFVSDFGFVFGIVYIWWIEPQNAPLWSVHFPLIPLVYRKTFPVYCTQDTGNFAVFALAPAMLESSGLLHAFHRVHGYSLYNNIYIRTYILCIYIKMYNIIYILLYNI